MTKLEFLSQLRKKLSGLPKDDIERSVEYYSEMIDDRMEDGVSEEESVESIGSVDEIVSGILADTPLQSIVKEKIKPKRALKAWEIILLILGSPVWVPLIFSAAIVVLSVYIAIWSVVFVFYSVSAALGAWTFFGLFLFVIQIVTGNIAKVFTLQLAGAALICAGFTILSFILSNLIAKGIIFVGKIIFTGIKRCFFGKEKK